MSAGDVGREQIFGAVALQTGFVTEGDLSAALLDCRDAGGRPLVRALIDRGALTEHQGALLEGVVDEYLRSRGEDRGPTPDGPDQTACEPGPSGAVAPQEPTDFISTNSFNPHGPGRALGSTKDAPATACDPIAGGAGPQAASAGPAARYRLLRLHARGGLGDVFVAHDEELNREVAVKQIRERHAHDARSRIRFLAEAEITGHLEHPGIVPVHGLGVDRGGRPYYAMRLIRGINLSQAIAAFHQGDHGRDPNARSLELRKLLRRVIDVCNAISYAHSRGVLHRDLKPENIMIGKYGETLVVDWGLAKMMDRPAGSDVAPETAIRLSPESGTQVTLPGSAMGTPGFMSPEQSAGELGPLGPQSDVYGLGATLYCVLAGKSPFASAVGCDIEVLLGRVRRGEFPPPRSVVPEIPQALEAICLKAMARDPVDRYPTPRDLANDLERWLAGAPVSAWPEPWSARAGRWLARHRSLLTLCVASSAIALLGAAAVAVVQTRANGRLVDSNRRLRATNQLAMDAIRAYYSGTSEDLLLKQPQFEELRGRLLRTPLDFFKRMAVILEEDEGGDPRSRAALGEACARVAEIDRQIGSNEDALAAYRHSLLIYERLTREDPADAGYAIAMAACHDGLASLEQATGRLKDSRLSRDLALRLWERLERDHPADPTIRASRAACLMGIGKIQGEVGQFEAALNSFRKAAVVLEGLIRGGSSAPGVESELAECLHSLGDAQRSCGREDEALRTFRGARSRLHDLAARRPAAPGLRRTEAIYLLNIAQLQDRRGAFEDALTSFGDARDILELLIEENPAVNQYRRDLAACHLGMTRPLRRLGRAELARGSFEEALAIARRLVKIDPSVTQFQETLAWCYGEYGLFLMDSRRWDEALAKFGEAQKIVDRLAEANPGVERHQLDRVHGYHNIGDVHLAAGRPERAIRAYETAREVLAPLLDRRGDDASLRHMMGMVRDRTGRGLGQLRRFEEARWETETAIRNERLALASEPASESYRRNLSEQYTNLIAWCRSLGRASELAEAAGDRMALWPGDASQCLATARDLASCIPIVGRSEGDADGAGRVGRERYADMAMDALRLAARAGLRDFYRPRGHPDFEPLWSRANFRELELEIMDRAFPGVPFGP